MSLCLSPSLPLFIEASFFNPPIPILITLRYFHGLNYFVLFCLTETPQEQQIAELMQNSGDSSNQLSTLNDQLAEKTRLVCCTLPVLLPTALTFTPPLNGLAYMYLLTFLTPCWLALSLALHD